MAGAVEVPDSRETGYRLKGDQYAGVLAHRDPSGKAVGGETAARYQPLREARQIHDDGIATLKSAGHHSGAIVAYGRRDEFLAYREYRYRRTRPACRITPDRAVAEEHHDIAVSVEPELDDAMVATSNRPVLGAGGLSVEECCEILVQQRNVPAVRRDRDILHVSDRLTGLVQQFLAPAITPPRDNSSPIQSKSFAARQTPQMEDSRCPSWRRDGDWPRWTASRKHMQSMHSDRDGPFVGTD